MTMVKPMTTKTTTTKFSPRFLCLLFLIFLISVWWIYERSGGSYNTVRRRPPQTQTQGQQRPQQRPHRIAIVIPFIGKGPESIPPYLNLFCTAAAGSSSLVDFLIIHNGALESYERHSREDPKESRRHSHSSSSHTIPSNVKFINLGSTHEMAQLLVRVVKSKEGSSTKENDEPPSQLPWDKQVYLVQQQLDTYPYALVEYKPAFGHIFADFLTEYSHWGYSDLDIAFGDLPRWITKDELTDYDIVTYGYGDQNRVYLRGQFTFHKNDPERINQLWRECTYLSELDNRYIQVLSGKEKMHFESAEGCYSYAVLQQSHLNVKYAVKAFTDAQEEEDSAGTNVHGLFLYRDQHRSVIYRPEGKEDGRDTLMLSPPEWYDRVTSTNNTPFQWEVGTQERIPRGDGGKCMFWVREKYQADICVSDVQATDTVFLRDGVLYKQTYQKRHLPSHTLTVPFFHFQEWKRYYRPSQNANVDLSEEGSSMHWALTKEGSIPLSPFTVETTPHRAPTIISSPLGIHPSKWKGTMDQLPKMPYCLRSARKKYPSNPAVVTCKNVVYWQDTESVEIIQHAPQWKYVKVDLDVTLALTLQISAEQASNKVALESAMDLAVTSMKSWQNQPCVLVVHVAGATDESKQVVRSRLTNPSLYTDLSSFSPESCLIAAIFDDESTELVSRKALLNMATDVSPTRWTISGLEVERGLIFSKEASFFARRVANIYETIPGHAFVIREIETEPEDDPSRKFPSLHGLLNSKESSQTILESFRASFPNEEFLTAHIMEHGQPLEYILQRQLSQLWVRRTSQQLSGEDAPADDTSSTDFALALNEIQLSLVQLLTNHDFTTAELPSIVLVDNIGPREGLRTTTLVREVEEFGGSGCFDGLRLGQLAAFGYSIDALPVAFVSPGWSPQKTTNCAREDDDPSCPIGQKCFMFEEEPTLLESIANDETKRPIKSAILWNELDSLR